MELNTNVGEMPIEIFGDYVSDCLDIECSWEYLIALYSMDNSYDFNFEEDDLEFQYGNGLGHGYGYFNSLINHASYWYDEAYGRGHL